MASIYNAANGLRSESGNPNRGFSRFSPQNVNNNFGSPNGPQKVDFGPDVFLTNEVHEINEFGKPLSGEGYNSNSDPYRSGKYGLSRMGMQSPWKNNNVSSGGYANQNGLQFGSDYQQSSGRCPWGSSHHNQDSRNFKSNYENYHGGNNSLGHNPYNYSTMNSDEQNVDYSYGGFGF